MQFNFKLRLYRHQEVMVEAIDEKHAKEQIERQMNSQKQLFEYVDVSDGELVEPKVIEVPVVKPKRKRKIKTTKPVAF
jgi:hypothetical protein